MKPAAVIAANATLVGSITGSTYTPSGVTTIIATGLESVRPPPPPPPPVPTEPFSLPWSDGSGADLLIRDVTRVAQIALLAIGALGGLTAWLYLGRDD